MVTRSNSRVSRAAIRCNGNPPRTRRSSGGRPRNPAHTPSALNTGCDHKGALADVTRYLKVIEAIAVTTEVALRRQNCEQDTDFAECLLHGVVNPLSIQIERISRLRLPAIKDAT